MSLSWCEFINQSSFDEFLSGISGNRWYKHSYYCSPNPDWGISDVTIYDGEDDVFDVKKVQSHLCQTCLDKVLEVMEVYAPVLENGYKAEE